MAQIEAALSFALGMEGDLDPKHGVRTRQTLTATTMSPTHHISTPLTSHRRADPRRFLGGQGEAQDLAPLLPGQAGRAGP